MIILKNTLKGTFKADFVIIMIKIYHRGIEKVLYHTKPDTVLSLVSTGVISYELDI